MTGLSFPLGLLAGSGGGGGGGGGGENPVTYDAGNSGAAITIDCANGPKQQLVLNAATPVVTITNLDTVLRLTLFVNQDGTGGRVPSFVVAGSTLVYQGGTAPIVSTGANAQDVLQFNFNVVSGDTYVDAGLAYAAP